MLSAAEIKENQQHLKTYVSTGRHLAAFKKIPLLTIYHNFSVCDVYLTKGYNMEAHWQGILKQTMGLVIKKLSYETMASCKTKKLNLNDKTTMI